MRAPSSLSCTTYGAASDPYSLLPPLSPPFPLLLQLGQLNITLTTSDQNNNIAYCFNLSVTL